VQHRENREGKMANRQLVGLTGSVILFVGVFTPIMSVPIVGSLNYFQNGKGAGGFIVAVAIVSALLSLIGQCKRLWITGVGALCVVLYSFFRLQNQLSQMKAAMETKLAGNPFHELADAAMKSIQMQWGWAILIVGAITLIVASFMEDELERAVDCPHCGGVVPLAQPTCNHCENRILWVQGRAYRPSRPAE